MKSKGKLKKIVVVGLISGTVLLLVATFLFSYTIPQLDSRISEKEREMEIFWKNSSSQVNADVSAYMAKNSYIMISLLPSDQEQKEAMELMIQDWISLKIVQIMLTCDKENRPSSLEVERLKKLSMEELDIEVGKRKDAHANEFNSTTVKKYDQLNRTKKSIVFLAILTQMFGLLITQVSIILQLKLS